MKEKTNTNIFEDTYVVAYQDETIIKLYYFKKGNLIQYFVYEKN